MPPGRVPRPPTRQAAQIRNRAEQATPGPWGTYHEDRLSDGTGLIDIAAGLQNTGHGYRCRRYIGQLESGQIDNGPAHTGWDTDRDYAQAVADADFIEHARDDVPALLAEIERLWAERDELNSMIRSSNAAAAQARSERDRYQTAWRMARTRALSATGAADRYATRARELQTALQDSLASILAGQMERDELRNAACEFRVPLPEGLSGYAEIVVKRWSLASDQWAITDGSHGLRAWAADGWHPVAEIGRDAAFRYSLDEALQLAVKVAETERERSDAEIRDAAGQAQAAERGEAR